jgi:hypothetical protein
MVRTPEFTPARCHIAIQLRGHPQNAARYAADRHHRRWSQLGVRIRRRRSPAASTAPRRLPPRRRRGRSLHAWFRRRSVPRLRVGGNWRHPADVWRRPALFSQGPLICPRHCGSWRHCSDRGGHGIRNVTGLCHRLVAWRRSRVWPSPLGSEHRRSPARHSRAPAYGDRSGPHRRWLADR